MSAREDAREGALFVAAGILAGVGNYLFQILASRQLSAGDFARLSGWLAHLSIAFVIAGLVQYAANFHPVARRKLRGWLSFGNLAALAAAGVWWAVDETLGPVTAVAITVLASVNAWAFGQAQIRFDFRGLAIAQILGAVIKVLIPLAVLGGLTGYAFGVGSSLLPSVWLLSWRLWRSKTDPAAGLGERSWAAPALIAVAANIIPQLDLILSQHTQGSGDFDQFARASLFYKGIYFFVFIFAQWILPRQIRGGGPRWLGPGLVAATSVMASLVLAGLTPQLSALVFHWTESPPRLLVLMSCLHMSVLTLLFLQIQGACAAGRLGLALGLVGALAVEGGVQLALAAPLTTYLAAMIVAQIMLVMVSLRVSSTPVA